MSETNEKHLRALQHLIEDSSIDTLKVSLESMFKEFLLAHEDSYPLNYHNVINDYFFLKEFLDKVG